MAGDRYALLIATGQYDSADLRRLRSPGRDVEGLAEVLADPGIGDFRVETVVDARHHEVKRAIERFFRDRSRSDVLLLHISCHGIKDDDGDLYFAARDTDRNLLGSSAVEAAFLHAQMRRCRALSIVLLLDCCYSGAFLPGTKGDTGVHLKDALDGHGRAVLTATNRTEYAWEGSHLSELEPEPSRFTGAVIDGLRSGEADGNHDGWVSHTDLYEYVCEHMHAAGLRQRPLLWAEVQFRVVIARARVELAPGPYLLGGRYELGGGLGRGHIAQVRLARDIRSGLTVVVKSPREDHVDPSSVGWFGREVVESAAALDHPGIVAVHGRGEDSVDGVVVPYLVTEYVDGSSLRQILDRDGRLSPTRARDVTCGILRSLEFAHRKSVLHGDIKATNVLVTRDGQVKVKDFGVRAPGHERVPLSPVQYLAPERITGRPPDARSDLYATGCLLYELLTGEAPFTGDTTLSVLSGHTLDDPEPPSRVVPAIPAELDAIVLRALAKDPDQRFVSAKMMRTALESRSDRTAGQHDTSDLATVTTGALLLTISATGTTQVARLPAGAEKEPRKGAEPEQPAAPAGWSPQPGPFLREAERATVVQALTRGRCVRLLGPSGSGRTTLLDRVAADCADVAPDGVIRLSGYRYRWHGELLHDLFAAVYDAPRYRPDQRTLLKLSRDIGAIVLIDEVNTELVDLARLLDALPECAVLVCPDPRVAPPPLEGAEDVMLRGLRQTHWLGTVEATAGRELTAAERSWAEDLGTESFHLPLRAFQAGALLRRRTDRMLPPARSSDLMRQLVAGLSDTARDAFQYAVALGGDLPALPHLPALLGDSHGDRAAAELGSRGLITATGSHLRLAGRQAHVLSEPPYLIGDPARARAVAEHYAWFSSHPQVPPESIVAEADAVLGALGAWVPENRAADQDASSAREGHLRAVVSLARAVAPVFAAGLRWNAWELALRYGGRAARWLGEDDEYFDHELQVLGRTISP
ncbi:protein kinase [Streptomyces cinnabarinus]|uniref:non-specific serine/threonine protein kinase n=1 Tax=Streptomyces cinnabarinus TaxID=67287 RepID=A0ABY7K7M2_9ACTN|nr:protein kinase [Streptomyces cinnabarinus]WAZ19548.1 protein kinase [Streptomyces cinnabarinus]